MKSSNKLNLRPKTAVYYARSQKLRIYYSEKRGRPGAGDGPLWLPLLQHFFMVYLIVGNFFCQIYINRYIWHETPPPLSPKSPLEVER